MCSSTISGTLPVCSSLPESAIRLSPNVFIYHFRYYASVFCFSWGCSQTITKCVHLPFQVLCQCVLQSDYHQMGSSTISGAMPVCSAVRLSPNVFIYHFRCYASVFCFSWGCSQTITKCVHLPFQVLCQCVLLFLRVQSDYHQMCSSTVAKLLQILIQVYSTTDSKDVLQQMNDLDLLPQNARHSPNRSPSLLKKKSPSSSPKIQVKHGALKSSFFSLFEKKMPSEESKSAFYVDLEKPGVSQSDSPAGGQVTGNNQSDILVQIGLDPVHEEDQGSEEVPPNFLDKNSLMPQSASSAGDHFIFSNWRQICTQNLHVWGNVVSL